MKHEQFYSCSSSSSLSFRGSQGSLSVPALWHRQPTWLWPSASLLHRAPLTLLRQHTRFPLQSVQKLKCLANKCCLFDNTEHYLQTVAPFNQHICPWFRDTIVAHFKSATKFFLRQIELRVSVEPLLQQAPLKWGPLPMTDPHHHHSSVQVFGVTGMMFTPETGHQWIIPQNGYIRWTPDPHIFLSAAYTKTNICHVIWRGSKAPIPF